VAGFCLKDDGTGDTINARMGEGAVQSVITTTGQLY